MSKPDFVTVVPGRIEPPFVPTPYVVISQGGTTLAPRSKWLVASAAQMHREILATGEASDLLWGQALHLLMNDAGPIWVLELGSGSVADGRCELKAFCEADPSLIGSHWLAPESWARDLGGPWA